MSEDKNGTVYDGDTNVLSSVFEQQFKKLNLEHEGEWIQVLKDIRKELNDDDLGRGFYNRFVEFEKEVVIPLALFIKKVLLGKCTGISFVDSNPLRVCMNQRIHIHKVFKGIAQRGKCSIGWFFCFKLHLICNEKGELLNFMITPSDVDDRKPLGYKSFVEFIYGKLVADKGYIGRNLFKQLFVDGIQLVTKLRSNMKVALMSVSDK